MFADILDSICGYYRVKSCCGEKILNHMMQKGIDFRQLSRDEDGKISFLLTHRGKCLLSHSAYEYRAELCGLPSVLLHYRKRPGIAVGFIIFFLLLKLSTLYVWNIDVTGNDTIPEEKILTELEALGCSPGAYIPDIDFYTVCNDFIERSGEVAWISVNMEGTSAHVVVREQLSTNKSKLQTPANVVARSDGYVRSVTVYSGKAEVSYDCQVKRGDLLISGVIENKNGSYRLERARGMILAETKHIFDIEIPYKHIVKKLIESGKTEKTLKIFGKVIKLFVNSRIINIDYDKIVTDRKIIFFGDIELPVTLSICEYIEYESVTRMLTPDEARSLALEEYASRVGELGAELLQSSVNGEEMKDKYILHCSLLTLDDIGETREIMFTDSEAGELRQ